MVNRLAHIVEMLEAERDATAERLGWLDREIQQFRARIAESPAGADASDRLRRGANRPRARERILGYISAHPGSTAGDVASALGLNPRSTATALSALVAAGALAKAQRGYRPCDPSESKIA